MRRKPYTVLGLRQKACTRCGVKPSRYQWSSCATSNLWMPICKDCDILLNQLVVDFFNFANKDELMKAYIEKVKNK